MTSGASARVPGGAVALVGFRTERGTQESNLALRFWRPPCYRYTSPPGAPDCRGWHLTSDNSRTFR